MLVSITPTHALSKENFKIEYREGQRERQLRTIKIDP